MNKYFLLITLLLCGAGNLFAGETFLLKTASQNFDVKINIAKCEDDICQGKASVYLLRKNQTQPFQTIQMPEMYLELGKDKKPSANLIELYGENNSGVVFNDFNFDGAEDLALRNGNHGSYQGPSYDVLLFSSATGRFAKNLALTKLASESLGLFTVDKEQKTIETFNKSGCCWHQTVRYSVINNRPLKIYVFTEDAVNAGEGKVKLTTETLVKGRWRKTTKTALVKDYYGEQQ
jgi:hypothetical protein